MNPLNPDPSFGVEWDPDPGNDLMTAFLAYFPSLQGYRVTRAENIVNQLLADDPLRNGTIISEGLYRIVVSPIAVIYEVDPANRLVRVTGLGYFPV